MGESFPLWRVKEKKRYCLYIAKQTVVFNLWEESVVVK
jgi:hypothetical protein